MQICLSSTDEGLRVYTTNTATLNIEKERYIQHGAQSHPLNTYEGFLYRSTEMQLQGKVQGESHYSAINAIFPETSKICQDSSEQLALALPDH